MDKEIKEKSLEIAEEIMEFGNEKDYPPVLFILGCTKVLKAMWEAKPDDITAEALLRDILFIFKEET